MNAPAAHVGRPGLPLIAICVAAAAAAVYANALANGYALDDDFIIRGNPLVHGTSRLDALLLSPWWPQSGEMYRPLTLLSFALEWEAFGEAPAVFHATNVLLHALVSVLVAWLVVRLGGGRGAALAAGIVFAVHPVHVEAVANLVGRAEVLATFFVLAACHLHLARRFRPVVRVAGIAALYLAALGAKESAVTLPALLLVVDALRTREERGSAWALLRRNAALLLVLTCTLGAYLAFRQALLGWTGTAPAPYLRDLSVLDRLATAARLWPEYLRLLFFPADLSAEWGPDVLRPATWATPMAWAGLLLVAALVAAAVASWRGSRWVAAAIVWFAAAVFPVSQVPFAVGVLLAERTLYLPSVALAFLFPAAAAVFARERGWDRAGAVALAAVVVLLAARTWTRTPTWHSTNAVFERLMRDHPRLWLVEWRAGELLVRASRADEALPWYRSAMKKVGGGHLAMGVQYGTVLLDLGRAEEAEVVLRRTSASNPAAPAPRVQLASALVATESYREALDALAAAERLRSRADVRQQVLHARALAYDGLGVADSALAVRMLGLREAGPHATGSAWFHAARLLAVHGRSGEAAAAADSARARFAPQYHPRVRVDPLPPLGEPLILGWGRLAEEGEGGTAP